MAMFRETKVACPPMLLGLFFHLHDVVYHHHWPKESSKIKSKVHVNVVFLLTLFLSHKSDLTQIITTTLTLLKPSSILPENSCVLRRMVDHGNNGAAAPNVEVPSLLEEGHMIPFLCHPGGKVRA